MARRFNDPEDDDRVSEALGSAILAKLAEHPQSPEAIAAKLTAVAEEIKRKYSSPCLSVEGNRQKLENAAQEFYDRIKDTKYFSSRTELSLIDVQTAEAMKAGFVSLVEGFDQANHGASGDSNARTRNAPAIALLETLKNIPSISKAGADIANNTAIALLEKTILTAIRCAADLGIRGAAVDKSILWNAQNASMMAR